MEDVFLLTLVIVNQDGEALIALAVSKDYKNVIKIYTAIKNCRKQSSGLRNWML